ncbi:SigE family RNA polymerase sigma factor [Actinoallomurus acanthiterrae]
MRTSDPPEVTPEDAISDLYRANSLRLARAALLLVGDRATAEDVVQEAFYGLQRRWLRDGGPDDPAAYVRTAVMNGCRSVLRRRRAARLMRVVHDTPVWSAESAALLGEERRAVLEEIARLPQRQREILVLRFYLDMSEAEIASELGVSRGTVSSTASRALATLANRLEGR